MSVRCFLVAETGDAWTAAGVERVGAMLWRHHSYRYKVDVAPRPMPHLAVMTPAGLVCLDCPSQAGTYWVRTGEPPAVTVTPSLNVSEGLPRAWHGWVTAGVLRLAGEPESVEPSY